MFQTICNPPQEAKKLRDKHNNFFVRSVVEEHRKEQKMREEDMRATVENPIVREEYEMLEVSKKIKAMKHDEHVTEKRRQQLRSNYEELRQLEQKLKAAQMIYDIKQQKITFTDKLKEKIRRKREEEVIEEAERQRQARMWKQCEIQEQNSKLKLRSTLLEQMADLQQRRKEEYHEKLKNREEMMKIKRSYEEEDERQRKARELRKERAKQEIKEFMELQERVKLEERQAKAEEGGAYLKILQEREEQQRRAKEEKQKQFEARQQLSMEIGTKIWKDKEQKRVREELIQDLLVEESKAKEDARRLKELQRKMDDRELTRQELDRYTEELRRRRRCDISEDDKIFLEEQERFLAEQDKKEQLKNERRHRANLEYRRALLDMIVEKRYERAEETAEALQRSEAVMEYNREVENAIKEERMRMLSEQRPEVLRYLPSSALRDEDRELFLGMLQKSSSSN